MTTQEFSDGFDALLNSYSNTAAFGEQADKSTIVLDEYEKSVLLTQAQDIIVKSYFTLGLNAQGEGFDDSPRRQVDFSNLIAVAQAIPIKRAGNWVPNWETLSNYGGKMQLEYNEKDSQYYMELLMDNVTVGEIILVDKLGTKWYYRVDSAPAYYVDFFTYKGKEAGSSNPDDWVITDYSVAGKHTFLGTEIDGKFYPTNDFYTEFDVRLPYNTNGVLFNMPRSILLILNESILTQENNKRLVVVPINYNEYDRQMSKSYSQPLKNQAWRLFQGNSNDDGNNNVSIISEIIVNENDKIKEYRLRYIRRPRPIVLTDLGFENQVALNIDGVSTVTECELNPILHIDILNKAVELALSTRGVQPKQSNQ